jgi:predicted metal-dependent peptidase
MAYDLQKSIYSLLRDQPFFSVFSRMVEKKATKGIPTAGVRVTNDGYFEMAYNPDFFENIGGEGVSEEVRDRYRKGVLMHEFYHIILGHITTRRPGEKDDAHTAKLWNYATDMAINSHIPNELPDFALLPGRGPFADFPTMQSSEFYYNKIREMSDEEQKNKMGEGEEGQMDDHGEWGEGNGNGEGEGKEGNGPVTDGSTLKEMAENRLKEMLKKSTQEVSQSSQGWGNISQEIQKHIMDMIRPAVVDWARYLRYFVKKSQRTSRRSTVRRLSRRTPYIHPGKVVKRQAKIAVSIDQSGSVDDLLLAKFFNELNGLAEHADFTVVPFDHVVQTDEVFEWKQGKKMMPKRVSCGGTDFDAPTDYVNGLVFDGHIVLTDMYAPKPGPSKCQRMWIVPMEQKERPFFDTNEVKIYIPHDM